MIDFTIKTLDSNNHHFSVDDEMTVQQLKERVAETMGIEINLQRLIFCGRVLQDDKKLADYDVNGKVVHLVQRAPPSPESRHTAHSVSSATNADPNSGTQQQIRRLMAIQGPPSYVVEEQRAMTMSPTAARLEFIRRMIAEIKISLATLRAHVENEPEPLLDENGEDAPDAATRAQNARRRAIRVIRARHSRPRDLSLLLEELDTLQEQFAPYRTNYIRLLRAAGNAEPPYYAEETRLREQRTVDMVADIMHSFAHAFHAISDINFQVGQRTPRLTSDAAIMRHPIPMQAHINFVQPTRRVPQASNANGAGNGTSAAPSAPQAPASAPPAEGAAPTADGTTGRNTTQPTVNINIQPDPVTYQLEIETRMPIAFALENALLNGLANASTAQPHPPGQHPLNQQQQQTQQPQQPQQQPQQQQPPLPQPQTQPQQQRPQQPAAGGQNPTGQAQANRRQMLLDFENLFRGLGQAGVLGGVEVVMSMEEIPQGGGLLANLGILPSGPTAPAAAGTGTGANPTGANNPTGPTPMAVNMPQADGAVYLGAMPWGGPPSADLLQNIVSSVIRQGLVPGVEGVALHAQMPTQNQEPASQQPNQNQGSAPNAAQANNPTANNSTANNSTANNPTGTNPTGTNPTGNQPNQPGQPSLHLRRATTTTRAQAVSLANVIYDRYLQCDSHHARRRMQRRRELHQQQVAAVERLRTERLAAQSIAALRERSTMVSQAHIEVIQQLLNSGQSQESWLNAALVAIARHSFLGEIMHTVSGEPPLLPNEFRLVRSTLRSYIQNLLIRAGNTDGDTAFQSVADFLINQFSSFIDRMDTVVAVRPDVNVQASLSALMRSRLPAVIACVMSDSVAETFAARFYSIFARLFTELCSLITYCCWEGAHGLRTVYNEYVRELIRDFDEPVRQMMVALATENLNFIMGHIEEHMDTIHHFIRRQERYAQPQRPTPMEMSPAAKEEPMQTSPPATPAPATAPAPAPECAPAPTSASAPATPTASAPAPAPATASASAPATATAPPAEVPAQASTSLYRQPAATSTATQSPTHTAPKASTAERPIPERPDTQRSAPESSRLVSPVMLMQQWDEQWVPILTRDMQLQKAEPQEPYSDAYLSGMPARKRRCVRQARPPTTLDAFVNDSVSEAAERPPAPDNSSIRSAFREHMRNMARARAASSEDYDPLRYASAERFLNAGSSSNQEQARSSSEPN